MAKTQTTPRGNRKAPLTNPQVAERAAQIDAARTALKLVTDAAADAQGKLDALGADATAEQKAEAEAALANAKAAVETATAELDKLVQAGETLPPAQPRNTPRSADQGGAGDAAGSAAGLVTITVIGPARGMRRAGFDFGPLPRTIEVTPQQKAAIEADPQLSIAEGVAPTAVERKEALARLSATDIQFGDAETAKIKVLGPKRGRRRAGFAFGEEAQVVEVDREQFVQILADEELAVTVA